MNVTRRNFVRGSVAALLSASTLSSRLAFAATNSFNTGGVQAANCVSCVGVDADGTTVLDFLNIHNGGSGVMNIDVGNTAPSPGAYGPGFWITKNTSGSNFGYTFANPFVASAGSGNWSAMFIALNEITQAAITNGVNILTTSGTANANLPSVAFAPTVGSGLQPFLSVGGSSHLVSGDTLVLGANHSLGVISAFGQADPTGFQFYVDGVLVAHASNTTGFGANTVTIGRVGGLQSSGAMTLAMAYAAYFTGAIASGIMSSTDMLNLHNSLTGGGAFSLINQGTPSGPRASQFFLRNWRQDKHSRIFLPA